MPQAASTDDKTPEGTRTRHGEMGRDDSPLAARCLRTSFPQQSRPFLLRMLLYRLTKALMLILKFLTKFVQRRLYLVKCSIGVFQCLHIVLLLTWELQISDVQVTQRLQPSTQSPE